MDPWIGQPSLSLDLNVGLPTARPVTKTKVLVEENFLSVKKERDQVANRIRAAGASSSVTILRAMF